MRIIDEPIVDRSVGWQQIVAALRHGHRSPKPQVGDIYFSENNDGLLARGAWISGLGSAVKAATIFPGNVDRTPALPSVQGTVLLFDPATGAVRAIIDGAAVTRWKTAGDSALGSELLSRPDSRSLLMVGAGTMAGALIRAHVTIRPSIAAIAIWNRSRSRAEALAGSLGNLGRAVVIADDLEAAVRSADIISSATMSTEPLIRGAWLQPGTHLDLVGAYTPQMREADDEAVRRARIYVDYRGTTVDHIGELMTPIANGTIARTDVIADLYDLVAGVPGRQSASDITLYKNGGGAHLDLMTALAIVESIEAGTA